VSLKNCDDDEDDMAVAKEKPFVMMNYQPKNDNELK
jgi:hypothetical protein